MVDGVDATSRDVCRAARPACVMMLCIGVVFVGDVVDGVMLITRDVCPTALPVDVILICIEVVDVVDVVNGGMLITRDVCPTALPVDVFVVFLCCVSPRTPASPPCSATPCRLTAPSALLFAGGGKARFT